jgi:hypothetical protein
MVLPKPGNFTIANPTETPMTIDNVNPITRRYIVAAILIISVKFFTSSTKDPATIAGDGNETSGQIPNMNTSCHIPMKAATNRATLARSSISNLTFLCLINDDLPKVKVRIVSPFPLVSRFCILLSIWNSIYRTFFFAFVSLTQN